MSSIKEFDFTRAAGTCPAEAARRSFTPIGLLRAVLHAVLNRRAARGLRELDDRLLDDIGLTRTDLERSFAVTGAFQDPTPGLTRAVRARAWRRFAARI